MKDKAKGVVLDLEEVTLVDLDVVRFLGALQAPNVELVNCSLIFTIGFSGSGIRTRGLVVGHECR
jgi:hypothetical protein